MVTDKCLRNSAIVGTASVFVAVSIAVIVTVAVIPTSTNVIPEEISSNEVWQWDCVSGRCEKFQITAETKEFATSLSVCKMLCNEFGNIWPRPTTSFKLNSTLINLDRNSITLVLPQQNGPAIDLLKTATTRFKDHIQLVVPIDSKVNEGGNSMEVKVNIKEFNNIDLTLETDESYTLTVAPKSDGRIGAIIDAETFFGARHGLETLGQLLVFDNIRLKVMISSDVKIVDKPVYPYRGILLDTARNFYSVDTLKRSLDAMGSSKLNRFHWHISDSHSFSFESKSLPYLTKYGSITPNKFYTIAQIKDLVQYALERGVKIIPEFDAPAHVGEGWQGTNLTVCFKAEPWQSFCDEPPCGQFDPTKEELYNVLEDLYTDMFDLFKPDIFHMGGDEVKNSCWNTSEEIQSWMTEKGWDLEDLGFFNLWNHFQRNARDRALKVNGGKKLPIILWTSTLTESTHIEEYLSNEDYIIQVWTEVDNPEIEALLNKGYKLIISNYDALYLDCGFGSWVGEGNNWCSPYKGWQTVYNNSPKKMAGAHPELILGGEAVLWSEQSDTRTLDTRLWPRAGALAERLWAEPETDYRGAESRMLHFRERLVRMGVAADAIQPEWCYQNEGYCYIVPE